MSRRVIVRVGAGAVLLVLFVLAFIHASPEAEARRRCVQAGWDERDLTGKRVRWTNWPILRRGEVEFSTRSKKIFVELKQPVFFLDWQVTDYREEPGG